MALCFWSSSLSAQILVGPTVGANYSWISFDDKSLKDDYRVTPVPGVHAGASLSFRVRKRFFLNTSLVYSSKGKTIEGKKDRLYKNDVKYHYIELPIVYTAEFKADLGNNKVFKWYLGAGPNISYWLGGRGTISSSDLDEVNLSEVKYKLVFNKAPETLRGGQLGVQDPNRIQLGLNIAAGFVLEPMGYQKIMLLFRYELGHSFLSRDTDGYMQGIYRPQDVMRVRNQGFRVSLSYLIDLKTETRKRGKSTFDRRKRQ